MITFYPHRGLRVDSLAAKCTFENKEAFVQHLKDEYGFWPAPHTYTSELYAPKDTTHKYIICINGNAVGFSPYPIF